MAFTVGNTLLVALALALVALSISDFLHKLGRTFPLLELIFLIAALQLLLGPYFAYQLGNFTFVTYRMHVSESIYMNIAVPSFILFLLGLMSIRIPQKPELLKRIIDDFVGRNPRVGTHLLLFGFVNLLIINYVPAGLQFLLYLASNFIYIGGILFYFNRANKHRLFVFVLVIVYAFVKSTSQGLFHDFLLWLILGSSLILIDYRIKDWQKYTLFTTCIFFLVVLQNIKLEFRTNLNISLNALDRIGLIYDLTAKELAAPERWIEPSSLAMLNARLNQGWITSAIMERIPSQIPFEGGRTILESFQNSLLPRVFFPDKKQAGGRENYRLYTGLPIDNSTSMGIGLLGEAYVNFGSQAGIYLFFWGLSLGAVTRVLYGLTLNKNVLFFFMIPLIFLQVVKAETDMITVLNHLVKSIIFVAVLFFLWFNRYK